MSVGLGCRRRAGSGGELGAARGTVYDCIVGRASVESVVMGTEVEGLEVVGADRNLVGAVVELVGMEGREYRLRDVLEEARARDIYKFVLLDCPPSLDLLTLNALAAADSVLIPVQCEYLALEGLTELLGTIERMKQSLNPNLEIEGILLTMYDERTTLARQVAEDVRKAFGEKVFKTVIPRNVRLAEAPSHGKAAMFYDMRSKGAIAYLELAKEVVANDAKCFRQGA
jgi:chromosome partitioning protein